MIKYLTQLIDDTNDRRKKKVAIAAAEDQEVLLAIKEAVKYDIVEPILIGNSDKIRTIARQIEFNINEMQLIDNESVQMTPSQLAVKIVHDGNADILMKGAVTTAELLKAVLDKEFGLRKSKTLSHVAFFQSPYYHKLLCVTDVAMNIAPDLETKKDIIDNAVEACHRIGIHTPKVAVIAAVETVNPKMEATIHADKLKQMNHEGIISGCIVDGPLAIDLAVSKKAAQHKGFESEVAGDCDIIVAPYIEAGNMFYKALNFLGGASSAAVIMGATVPIVLTSRSDDEKTKYLSIALAAAMQ